MQEF